MYVCIRMHACIHVWICMDMHVCAWMWIDHLYLLFLFLQEEEECNLRSGRSLTIVPRRRGNSTTRGRHAPPTQWCKLILQVDSCMANRNRSSPSCPVPNLYCIHRSYDSFEMSGMVEIGVGGRAFPLRGVVPSPISPPHPRYSSPGTLVALKQEQYGEQCVQCRQRT